MCSSTSARYSPGCNLVATWTPCCKLNLLQKKLSHPPPPPKNKTKQQKNFSYLYTLFFVFVISSYHSYFVSPVKLVCMSAEFSTSLVPRLSSSFTSFRTASDIKLDESLGTRLVLGTGGWLHSTAD